MQSFRQQDLIISASSSVSPLFGPICRSICTTLKFVPQPSFAGTRNSLFDDSFLASLCFPTTIYDVMKHLLSCRIFSFALPPTSPFHHLISPPSCLFDSSANNLPLSSYPTPFIPPTFFFPIDFPDFSKTKRTDPNFAIPQGFIYSSSKFRVFRLRFVGVSQFSFRLCLYEPFANSQL